MLRLGQIPPPVAEKTQYIDFLPAVGDARPVLSDVAVLVTDGVAPFELGVVCEVFGLDRSDDGVPVCDFAVCTPRPGPVRTSAGFDLRVELGLERAQQADLVVVPAILGAEDGLTARVSPKAAGGAGPPPEAADAVHEVLRAAVDRGAWVLSLCVGAFVLGDAGLLDGRRCTTHWRHAAALADRFPAADVDADVLYVEDGPVVTSAGTAAGVDACLHLVRSSYGAAAATAVARRMVVPPHRDGGQAQYIRSPVPGCDAETLAPVLQWTVRHLDEDLSVARLAARARLSPRTFARRFRDETGTTPHQWVVEQRLLLAEELLEQTGLSVEQVAARVGFGSAAVLRHHWGRARSTSPQQYRRTFSGARAG